MHHEKGDVHSFYLITWSSKADHRQWRNPSFNLLMFACVNDDSLPQASLKRRPNRVVNRWGRDLNFQEPTFWQQGIERQSFRLRSEFRDDFGLKFKSWPQTWRKEGSVWKALSPWGNESSLTKANMSKLNEGFLHCLWSDFDDQDIKWKLRTSPFSLCMT